MRRTFTSGLVAAVALAGLSAGAIAQAQAPSSEPTTQRQPDPPNATAPNPSVVAPAEPSSQVPARSETSVTGNTPPKPATHNSTTGAAATDVPTPSVVTHIVSPQDAAKFNETAAENDKKPILAHALALTDEQRQMIAASLGNAGAGVKAEQKPEVAALLPPSARVSVRDLPPGIDEKISWLKPYKVAVVDNQILLVDPRNSFVVLDIIKR